MSQDYGFRVRGLDVTFKNNVASPLTSADVGKPVAITALATAEITLCSNGDAIDGVVIGVDSSGVTVRVQGICECAPLAGDSIIDAGAVYAVAGTGGKVKYTATHGNAKALAYNAATGKIYIRIG
jgi:hypothetical protein